MRLLLVEDDEKLSEHLATVLQQHGFATTAVADPVALEAVLEKNNKFDIVILDRLLGTFDTKSQIAKVKRLWPQVSILVLSAISTPNERTEVLNLGADDYVGKPFSTQELIARLRVLQRRVGVVPSQFIQLGTTVIDSLRRAILVNDKSAILPAKEFLLLKTLCNEAGRVWSRADLLDYVWEINSTAETNVVEATVTNLRRRLQELGSQLRIKNMRNVGYWVED